MQLSIQGLTEINIKLDKLQSLINNAHIAAQIAGDARAMIAGRNALGLDVDYNEFDPYSTKPYYRSKKERPIGKGGRGRRLKKGKEMSTRYYEGGYAEFARATKKDGFPNLFATGDMMRAFQAREKGGGERALVHFTRYNAALKAIVNNAKRTFVGINPDSEEPRLVRAADKLVKKAIHGAGL